MKKPARLAPPYAAACVCALCAALTLAARAIMSGAPEWVERWYSRGLYAWLAAPLSRAIGVLPFSLAEVLVLTAPLAVLAAVIAYIVRAVRRGRAPRAWARAGAADELRGSAPVDRARRARVRVGAVAAPGYDDSGKGTLSASVRTSAAAELGHDTAGQNSKRASARIRTAATLGHDITGQRAARASVRIGTATALGHDTRGQRAVRASARVGTAAALGHDTDTAGQRAVRALAHIGAVAAALACALITVFYVSWGFNYYRLPYARVAGYDMRPASVGELRAVCDTLLERASALRDTLPEDADGVCVLTDDNGQHLTRVQRAYDNAVVGAPWLEGRYGTPKRIALSGALSHTRISGIFIPFTFESNVNTRGPVFMHPATACHEAAHQRGFAREDEANFIAYYVCMASDDADFQYSGVMLALLYAQDALADVDYPAYQDLRARYNEGMRRDLRAYSDFWNQYNGPAKEAQTRINDAYLKSNGQTDGVQSYGRMVDLLIAELR